MNHHGPETETETADGRAQRLDWSAACTRRRTGQRHLAASVGYAEPFRKWHLPDGGVVVVALGLSNPSPVSAQRTATRPTKSTTAQSCTIPLTSEFGSAATSTSSPRIDRGNI